MEDLHCLITAMEENDEELIAAAVGSLFSREIHKAGLLEGFKILTIKAYEGKSDHQDHLDHFNDLMELHLVSEIAKCRVFVVTLTGGAKTWLKAILAGSIINWQQLSTFFLRHFQATKKSVVPLAHLGNVKQKKGESLKSSINCFNVVSNFVTWSPKAGVLTHLTNSMLPKIPFWDEL